jgi:hypothetical protein
MAESGVEGLALFESFFSFPGCIKFLSMGVDSLGELGCKTPSRGCDHGFGRSLSLSNTRANSKNLLINSQIKNCLGVIEGNGQGRMSSNGDDEIG